MIDHYDVLYILPGTKSDEEVKPMMEKVRSIVAATGATDIKMDFWGKRRLAYEINGLRSGYYDLVQFDLDTAKIGELERTLRLDEDVVRHQITVRKVLTPEQQAATDQLRERIAAKRQAVKDQEAAATIKAAEPAEVTPAPAEPVAPVTPEQLDKKLEEILESDSINV